MRAALIAIAIFAAAPARADDPLSDDEARHQQGLKLMELDRYADALAEFQAAYAARQRPILLYEMGRAQQKLGHAEEASALFERYLVADPVVSVTRRSEVEGRLHVLERKTLPPPRSPNLLFDGYVKFHYEMRPYKALLAAGGAVLAIGYLPALITGGVLLGVGRSGTERAAGGTLLIPVLGPIISSAVFHDAVWAGGWVLVDASTQVAGLALLIAGAAAKQKTRVLDAPIAVTPQSLPGGAGLVAWGSF